MTESRQGQAFMKGVFGGALIGTAVGVLFATEIYAAWRNRQRQLMDPHRQGEQVLRAAPIESFCDDFVAPDMLAAERFGRRERIDSPGGDDFREKIEADDFRGNELSGNLVEALLRRRDHGLTLLMKKGRKQKEARMFHLETVSPLRNAAFAQDEDLFPASERIDDDCPLFESGPHERKIAGARQLGNAAVS